MCLFLIVLGVISTPAKGSYVIEFLLRTLGSNNYFENVVLSRAKMLQRSLKSFKNTKNTISKLHGHLLVSLESILWESVSNVCPILICVSDFKLENHVL